MSAEADEIESTLKSVDTLRKRLAAEPGKQVRSAAMRDLVAATSQAWFRNRLPNLKALEGNSDLDRITTNFKELLEASARATTHASYKAKLKQVRDLLITLRGTCVALVAPTPGAYVPPPDFSAHVSEPRVRALLANRWDEVWRCLDAKAPMAAVVMMGGLLESILMTISLELPDKSVLFRTKAAPIDRSTGKPSSLQSWMLRNYIDVGAELGWFSPPVARACELLGEYRNFIHPHKQLSHEVQISSDDAAFLWDVCVAVTKGVLRPRTGPSAPKR